MSFATVTGNAASSFRDLPSSHWAYENVAELTELGAISGYPNGTFRPNQTLTYGEFIKMVIVVSYDDINQIETDGGFRWAEPFYDYMINKGIFTSSEISKNKLNRGILRKDMALIISRVLKNEEAADIANLRGLFNDTQDENVLRVCGLGIISGYPDKTFRPDNRLTRAEASSVLIKIIDKNKRVQPTLTQTETSQVTPVAVETSDGWIGFSQAKSAEQIKTRTYKENSGDKEHALVFTTDKTFLQDILRDCVEDDVSGVKNALYLNRDMVYNDGCMYISNIAGFDKMRFSFWSYGHATVKIYGFTQDQYANIKTSDDLKNLRNNLGDIVFQREIHLNGNNHIIEVDFDGLSSFAGIYILLHSDVDEESVLQINSHYVFLYNPEFSK